MRLSFSKQHYLIKNMLHCSDKNGKGEENPDGDKENCLELRSGLSAN